MNKTLRIFLIFLGISFHLNGQTIIKSIEQALVKDSISFGEIELGFDRNKIVKSNNDRYYVFNSKLKLKDNFLLFTPKKYYIFDLKEEKVYKLQIKTRFENYYNYKFAKFYDSKLILVYEKLAESNFHIDEFNLTGKKMNSKEGICPTSHLCKCYDATSDFVIWINDGLHLLDLEKNQSKELAQLYLELGSDNNFHNSPQIELDHVNRKVLIKQFIDINKQNEGSIKQYSIEKRYIKPIAKYEIIEGVMIFDY